MKEEFTELYHTVNLLMCRLSAEGMYHPDMNEVSDVMNALHDIDGGVYDEKFKLENSNEDK